MTIATFKPEVWSADLLVGLEKNLVFGSPAVCNTDFQGEISKGGDTVHINSISDPTISTYTPSGTITYEDLHTVDQVLVIDQSKSFSFKVDDVDKAQAAGDMMGKAMGRAGYKLRDYVDQTVEALFAGVPSANALGTVQVDTAAKAFDNVLVELSVQLDEANVPTEGRFCVIPPWFHGRLRKDDRFVRADAAGGVKGGVQGNGMVGEAAGFNIFVSNNCSLVTGDDFRVSAGVTDAITLATQISDVEALRLQGTIADAVRGLLLFGAKLVRPEMIATAIASQT
jgi:hypothetical protein